MSKADKYLAKRGLESLDTDVQKQVNNISAVLAGNGLMKMGTLLTGSGKDSAELGYLSALVEQNWIIIKQQDEVIKLMKKGN